MSILIKGMEMPKSCEECRFLDGEAIDGLCHASEKWLDDDDYFLWFQYPEGDIDDSKPANCPLIEIPPHGRLIDADALDEKLMSGGCIWPEEYAEWADECFANATTVIEAEGREG